MNPANKVILIYLVNTKLEFLENKYSEKGRRIGSLIEAEHKCWEFYPERGAGGLTSAMLSAIVTEQIRLWARSLLSTSDQKPLEPPLGHIVPEPPSDVL
jgi:hypothetical protein